MEHLSNWHDFNPTDRSTYPKMVAPVQVKLAGGQQIESTSFKHILSSDVQITGWRYIRQKGID
jgi:hypothetical protein